MSARRADVDLGDLGRVPDPFAGAASSAAPPAAPRPARASPTRAGLRMTQIVAASAAIAYDAAGLVWFEPHAGPRSAASVALGVAVPCAAGSIAVSAATRRGRLGLGEPALRVALAALAAVALFVCATSIGPWSSHDARVEPFWTGVARCMALSALFAAGPAVLAAWAVRRVFTAAPAARAAALGVACGALASATLGLVCPDAAAPHVLLGHGSVMVVMGAAGAWIGRWLARV
ncbi:MAG TPA: NrsF family protein [Polyangiaceae bacterium]|nr:NrsF family protein [Polyangiaceae bacterium]